MNDTNATVHKYARSSITMRPSALLGAAMLSFIGSTFACSCIIPPPLSECVVREDQAALLVTVKCVKSLQCDLFSGTAVADVMIDQVFQDNTNLTLTNGTMITISSGLQGSLCGFGPSLTPSTQLIVFANIPVPPFMPNDDEGVVIVPGDDLVLEIDEDVVTPGRRLMQEASIAVRATSDGDSSTVDVDVDVDPDNTSVFSDGTICDVMTSDLETSLCSGNLLQPSMQNITDLMMGCAM